MKSFEFKLYSKNGTFKKTINPKNITSEVSFSEDLEGGQSDLNIQIIGSFGDFLCSDILEIREVDEENYAISRTYTGIIEEIDVDEYETHDVVSLQVLGLFTALNDIMFKQGGNRVFSVNMTPGNMVKAIIDSFNAEYGILSGTGTNLISNNSFETNLTGYSTYGAATNTRVLTEAYIGLASMQIVTTGASQGTVYGASGLSIGQTYTISCFSKGNAGGENLNIYIDTSANPQTNFTLSNGWKMYSQTFIATSGSHNIYIRNMGGSGTTYFIDSVKLETGSVATRSDTQNLLENLFRYTAGSIDDTGTALNREFDNASCFDALKKALENTSFSFFIGSDGIVNVQQDAGQTKTSLTMGREVVKVNRKLHKREMVNKYYHERISANEQIYTDPSSIALFNLKERKEVDSDVLDATSQNVIGNKKIADYAYERNEISILMKPQKSESIFPGMLLSVNNIRNTLVDKKITKITKGKDSWTIYVGDFISFGNSVLKK